MRTRTIALFALALAALLSTSVQAGAATRIGSDCPMTGTSATSLGLPGTSPISSYLVPADGVIVNWGSNVNATSATEVLIVATQLGPTQFRVDAASIASLVPPGVNNVPARIPVKAGQMIGSATSMLHCADVGSSVRVEMSATPTAVGSVHTPAAILTSSKLALFADIEADGDHDGFGDETQDKCPQLAAYQTTCPAPLLGATVIASGNSVTTWLTTDLATTAQASASVKLPASRTAKAKTLTFAASPVSTSPGALTKVTLRYPSSLKRALAKLSARKSLKLNVQIVADGILLDTTKKFTVKLRGSKR